MRGQALNAARIALIVAAAALPSPGAAGGFDFFQPVDPPRAVQAMVHRGASGRAPENSAKAIELCAADRFEWAEIDIRLTGDGHHVLFHDSWVEAKSDGEGEVCSMPLERFVKLDIGAKFAKRQKGTRPITLDEALAAAKGKVNLCLDCKAIDPELLARQVLAAGMERQVVAFDDLPNLARIRAASEGRIAIMPKWHPEMGLADWIERVKPDAVEIDCDEITPEIAAAFHAKGIKVQAKNLGEWDAPKFWSRAMDCGADWMQTDLPEEIIAHAAKRGASRPALMSLHRGASRYAPENTIAAFDKALSLGADYIEFDVRTTKDGLLYLLHDSRLDRTTDGKGPLKEMAGAELDKLDAGAWFAERFAGTRMPTLDEFLARYAGKAGLYFDAKEIEAEKLAEALDRHEVVEETVVYGGEELLARLKAINPRIRVMPSLDDPAQVAPIAERLKPFAFDTRWEILSKELIDAAHAASVLVFSDAMGGHDNAEAMAKAMELGIDLIQTDQPAQFHRAVELFNATLGKSEDDATEAPPPASPSKE